MDLMKSVRASITFENTKMAFSDHFFFFHRSYFLNYFLDGWIDYNFLYRQKNMKIFYNVEVKEIKHLNLEDLFILIPT